MNDFISYSFSFLNTQKYDNEKIDNYLQYLSSSSSFFYFKETLMHTSCVIPIKTTINVYIRITIHLFSFVLNYI
jgi:hypothetical protein